MESEPEMRAKAVQLLQITAGDPRWEFQKVQEIVGRAFGIQNPRSLIANKNKSQSDALYENEDFMAYGVIENPLPGDDHQTHLMAHQQKMADPKFDTMPPASMGKFKLHVQEHQKYVDMIMAQQAQGAQTPGVMGEPSGASPVQNEANANANANFDMGSIGAAQNVSVRMNR